METCFVQRLKNDLGNRGLKCEMDFWSQVVMTLYGYLPRKEF